MANVVSPTFQLLAATKMDWRTRKRRRVATDGQVWNYWYFLRAVVSTHVVFRDLSHGAPVPKVINFTWSIRACSVSSIIVCTMLFHVVVSPRWCVSTVKQSSPLMYRRRRSRRRRHNRCILIHRCWVAPAHRHHHFDVSIFVTFLFLNFAIHQGVEFFFITLSCLLFHRLTPPGWIHSWGSGLNCRWLTTWETTCKTEFSSLSWLKLWVSLDSILYMNSLR